ncbi:MAG: signal peptide peptidase SppA [Alphaproteobacteria bacterium]|nr:signal peptide peptidase SppA [Alphaproteobacteria bacterium]
MKRINFSFIKQKNQKKKHKTLKNIIKVTICALAIIGFLAIVCLFNLLQLLKGNQSVSVVSIPKNAIITVDLNRTYNETYKDGLFSDIDDGDMTYFDLIKNINIAMLDDNVKALIARINTTGLGLAQIQHLRATIHTFRRTGKKAYIFSSNIGDLGQGTDEYYLATAFDEIYLQPNADLGITGINIEIPFIKDTLKKIGLDAEFYTRYEFKNAVASLTDSQISASYKQQMTKLGKGIYNELRNGIAQARQLMPDEVDRLINKAPFSAEDALKYKLIDGVSYYSDLVDRVKKDINGETISLQDYASNYTQKTENLPAVAYLALEGTIVEGSNAEMDLSQDMLISSDQTVKTIQEISKNKNIKALIVRIDSPGGSYTASNIIWHELEKLKQERHIPIVVSMGNYAASGGYFIALAGDKIFADPLTLTGSIGVLGGKFVTSGLMQKLGMNWGTIQFGENAGMLSSTHKFTASEKQAFNKSLDNIYQDFTDKVSQARHINNKDMDKLARGRVWLGAEAAYNGLIDGIGDIDKALSTAKELGEISPTQKFDILMYPKPKTFAEKLNDFIRKSPQISINRLASKIGLDIQDINVLQHLQYDCITTPFIIKK